MDTFQRIKEKRKSVGLSQEKLAELMGISFTTIRRWERGESVPDIESLQKLARVLQTTTSYLLGETQYEPRSNVDLAHSFIEVPLFDMATAASCGAGNGLYGVEPETAEMLYVDASDIQNFDNSRKPFAIHTDGDSMTGASIEEGSIVLINPADEVVSGNTALVVYNDNWMVKWVVFRPDGAVELRSANPNYAPIVIEKEYAQDAAWFRIVGKVIQIISKKRPRNAF